VAILREAESIRLTVPSACRLTDLKTGEALASWPELKWQETRAGNPGLRIGGSEIASSAVVLQSAPGTIFRVNSQPYRGDLILRRSGKDRITVINRLPLEEYLVGALTSEVSAGWPLESLKAHAVVSRTMAAHRIWIRKNQPYDMTADVSTHLYYGVNAERESTRQAVQQTAGQVLAWNGELFSATFHANCGGHTENAAELWELKNPVPPLAGVADPYCKDLKHFRWKSRLSTLEFLRLLGEAGRPAGTELSALEITQRNPSGRVRSVRLQGPAGEAVLTGRKFRELLGANRLRSLNFTAGLSAGRVTFSGLGWGHGVGLCQWGAYGMGRAGRPMEEILDHYFPGAKRRPLKGLPGFS